MLAQGFRTTASRYARRMSPTLPAIAAATTYLVATYVLWRALTSRTGERPLAALGVGAAALLLHAWTLGLALYGPEGFTLDLLRTASVLAWEVAALTLLAALTLPVGSLGLVALPIGAIGSAALVFDFAPVRTHAALTTAVEAHVILSLLAYGLLLLAAAQALLLWYQERRLQRHELKGLIGLLPPLAVMESLLFQILLVGVVLLTCALATGLTFVEDLRAQHLVHKTVLSVLAWVILVVLLWGRWRHGWRGPRAVALTLAGFATLVLAYFGSRFVLEVLLGRSWS
jgi:ABC-type uncharacterized transport system permease subunit